MSLKIRCLEESQESGRPVMPTQEAFSPLEAGSAGQLVRVPENVMGRKLH